MDGRPGRRNKAAFSNSPIRRSVLATPTDLKSGFKSIGGTKLCYTD